MKPRRLTATRIVPLALALLVLGLAPPVAAEPIHIDGRGHVQDRGWLQWVADSQVIGTTGKSRRLEAVQLRGGVGEVAAHVQDLGWLAGVPSGTEAGTTGRSLRLEAVRVRSDVPGWAVRCQAHVQDLGWLPWVADGQTCGTTGRSLRLEAIRLHLEATS